MESQERWALAKLSDLLPSGKETDFGQEICLKMEQCFLYDLKSI